MADEHILKRIRTLLRLSKSGDNLGGGGVSVEETANAAAMAQRLMSKHQIEEADLGDLEDDGLAPGVVAYMGDDGLYRGRNLPFWLCRLGACIGDLNSCECFVQTVGKERIIGIVGLPRDVSVVRYMFTYLRKEIPVLCGRHPQTKKGSKWRNDFKLGATDEVIVRMREAKDDAFQEASKNALVRLDAVREAAKTWTEENVTRAGHKRKPVEPDPRGYHAGRIAGREISLESSGLELPEGEEQTHE